MPESSKKQSEAWGDFSAKELALFKKAEKFISLHLRVVEDFERSLANANHCLNLARLGVESEPVEALAMIEQIEGFELFSHLQQQFDSYESVSNLLEREFQMPRFKKQAQSMQEELPKLRERYLEQLREAETQKQISQLLIEKLRNVKGCNYS